MSDMRTIEIDFDVHKRLETERNSFAESANDTLRRLLKIETAQPRKDLQPQKSGRPWAWKGIELSHGTELKMDYNGRKHVGYISNGVWIVEGAEFNSPSAACSVARTKAGKSTPLDGWKYWYVRQPGQSQWVLIDQLRKR